MPHPQILIVDKDLVTREALSCLLSQEGYQVKTVGLGAEAIDQVRLEQYGAVLLDIELPDFDGLSVMKALLKIDPFLPFIVLIGNPALEGSIRTMAKGAFAYLTKPYNPHEIEATLRRATAVKHLRSENAHVEHALSGGDDVFRSIVRSAIDAIIVADHEGRIVSWNDAASQLFGYAEGEVLGQSLTLIMPERYREAHQKGLQRMQHTGMPVVIGKVIELHGSRKDGSEFPLELSLTTSTTEAGTFYSGIIRDVSQRKIAESALAERNRLLALDAAVGQVLIQNQGLPALLQGCAQALVQHLDAAFARIWTLNSKEQVLELQASAGLYTHLNGRHSRVPVGQLRIGQIAAEKKPHLTNEVIGDPRVPEQEWAKREGLVAFAGYPLLRGEEVMGVMALFSRHPLTALTLEMLGMVADRITVAIERERSVKALRKLARHEELILASAGEGIFGLDLEGKATFVNPAAANMLGYEVEELHGMPMHATMHHTKPDGSPYPSRECPMYAAFKDGAVHQIDSEVLWRKDGTSFPVEYTSTPMLEEGHLAGAVVAFRDITKRIQAEEARRQAEEQYRDMVENAVEGIFQTTPSGRFLKANPALAHILGYDSPEELLASVTDIGQQLYAEPEHRHEYKALLQRQGIVREFETQCYRKDGHLIWVSVSARTVRDSHGGVLYYEGTLEDVSDRKRSAERLAKINDCLLSFERDHSKHINRLTALCGELLGGTWALYSYLDGDSLYTVGRWRTPPDFKAVNEARGLICPLVIDRGGNEPYVVRNLPETPYAQTAPYITSHQLQTYVGQPVKREGRSVGSLCVLFQRDFVPTEADRRVMGIIASAIGVEEDRRKAEQALRKAYDETESILSSLPVAILILEENQLIIWANSLARQYFGGGRETIEGSSLSEILPSEDDGLCGLDLALTPHGSHSGHSNQDREFQAEGHTYRYRCFPVALRSSERPHIGLVIVDITEGKQLEAQLVQAEKLAGLGTLVSGMAHEVNNPAQAILGLSELTLDEDNLEKVKEYARDIKRYSQHVASVVRDFASYARPASREEAREIDLNARLTEALRMVQRGPHFGKVEVLMQLEPVPPIWAHRVEIDQLFINLISNAVQAMQGNGHLTLATSFRRSMVTARISDTGCGIPKSLLNKIYEPFFTTKGAGQGTGLGLSIVHKIVSKCGGTIDIESEVNKGTTFTIRFPGRPAGSEAAARATHALHA